MRPAWDEGEPFDLAVRAADLPQTDLAVFSPSGALVRLRRGNKHEQALAAIIAASGAFHVPDAAAADVVLLEGIRRGIIEVM